MRIYFDACAINCLTDDSSQQRIHDEAGAVESILRLIASGSAEMIAGTSLRLGKIVLRHIQQGRSTQNGHVESFRGKLRDGCLRTNRFRNLFDARMKVSDLRKDYNEVRPHISLDYRPPDEFARALEKPSYGKDAGYACLEKPSAFPTLPQLRRRDKFVRPIARSWGHIWTRLACKSFLRWSQQG